MKFNLIILNIFVFIFSNLNAQRGDTIIESKTFFIKQLGNLDTSRIYKINFYPNSEKEIEFNDSSLIFDIIDKTPESAFNSKNTKSILWENENPIEYKNYVSLDGGTNTYINGKAGITIVHKENGNLIFNAKYKQAKGLKLGLNLKDLNLDLQQQIQTKKIVLLSKVFYEKLYRNVLAQNDTLNNYITQNVTTFGALVGFQNVTLLNKNLNYAGNLHFDNMNQKNLTERKIVANITLEKLISDKYKVSLSPFISSYLNSYQINSIIGLNVSNYLTFNKTTIQGLFSITNLKPVLFFNVKTAYNINNQLVILGELYKKCNQNSYHQIIEENPYIDYLQINLKNTFNQGISVGLNYSGNILNKLDLSIAHEMVENFQYFSLDTTNKNHIIYTINYENVKQYIAKLSMNIAFSKKIFWNTIMVNYFIKRDSNHVQLINFIPYLNLDNQIKYLPIKELQIIAGLNLKGNRGFLGYENDYQVLPKFVDLYSKLIYSIKGNWDISAGIQNIFNSNYSIYSGYPNIGRIFHIGILAKF